MVTCLRCGTENKEGAIFCKRCGAKLLIAPEVTPPTPAKRKGGAAKWIIASIAGLAIGLIIVAIILVVPRLSELLPNESPRPLPPTVVEEDGYYVAHYEWSYGGNLWTYDTKIPKETYEYFWNKPRTSDYSEYVDNPVDDEWMENLADLFSDEAEKKGWGEFRTVSFVLAFVQSMPYTSDDVTTGYDEYPRYPVETVVEAGGDCEDTSVLFSSLVRGMGYGTVLLKLEEDDHMAVGVLISQNIVNNWDQSYSLTYYTSNGNIYAYCETTGEGWELGHKPDNLKSTTARLIPV